MPPALTHVDTFVRSNAARLLVAGIFVTPGIAQAEQVCDYPNDKDAKIACLEERVESLENRTRSENELMDNVENVRAATRYTMSNTLVLLNWRTPAEAADGNPRLLPQGHAVAIRDEETHHASEMATAMHVVDAGEIPSFLRVAVPKQGTEGLWFVDLAQNPDHLPVINTTDFALDRELDLAIAKFDSIQGRCLLPHGGNIENPAQEIYFRGLPLGKGIQNYDRLRTIKGTVDKHAKRYYLEIQEIGITTLKDTKGRLLGSGVHKKMESGKGAFSWFVNTNGTVSIDVAGVVVQGDPQHLSGSYIVPSSAMHELKTSKQGEMLKNAEDKRPEGLTKPGAPQCPN